MTSSLAELTQEDPRRIGAYRLLGRLGSGGMGQVYLARSRRSRTVAVKLVHRELAALPEFRTRFRQEVAAARRIGGEWTAPVLDADTEAEVPWVATGYIAGPSLQDVVGRDFGPLPERSVRILGAGLARSLKAIHAAGIVHRDLKPSNVLLTIDGPRVIDFGIARALDAVTDSGVTRTGTTLGSPAFMSPEQVRGEKVTAASDTFSLGSVLMFAATGQVPYGTPEGGVHGLLFRIATEDPDLAAVPEGLRPLISALMVKAPAERPEPADVFGAEEPAGDDEPWLPSGVVAELGRHVVSLLEIEDSEGGTAAVALPDGPVVSGSPVASPGPPAGPPPGYPAPTTVDSQSGPTTPLRPGTPPPGTGPAPYVPPGTVPPGTLPYEPTQIGPAAHASAPAHIPGGPPGRAALPPGRTAPQPTVPSAGSRTSRIALAVTAVIIAGLAGGGGAVLALRGDDKGDQGATGRSQSPVSGRSTQPAGGGASPGGQSPGASETPSDQESSDDGSQSGTENDMPAAFVGTWTSTFGGNTRELTLSEGKAGDEVMHLTGEGTSNDNQYHCEWTAELASRPLSGGPLHLGPSTVRTAEPSRDYCKDGPTSTLTLLPDGGMRRELTGSGKEPLTYTKDG